MSDTESKSTAQSDFRDAEHSSLAGAQALAARIEKYWAAKGHKVQTRVVNVKADNKQGAVFGVKTNLVGGWPVQGAA